MTTISTSTPMPSDLSIACFDQAPLPMATVEGAMHIVRYVNPAFCRLIDRAEDAMVGKSFREMLPEKDECLALLDRVYRTGKSDSSAERKHSESRSVLSSYTMWPVMADERTMGVMILVNESAPLYEKTLAMSEALLLGALRQHELSATADLSNIRLHTEVGEHKQRERDALTLTQEVSHRIKNNLQVVFALITREVNRAPAPCVQGYEAMQARIGAIAELYDLMSRTASGSEAVPVDEYLKAIARNMSTSLLESTSGIEIEVKAEALDIDAGRALPFGLLVNELATNAIKHAFPDGKGRIVLSVQQIGDHIELTVADNGVGMKDRDSAKAPGTHGADYVSIFVRQLGGTIAVRGSAGTGTIVKILLPLRQGCRAHR